MTTKTIGNPGSWLAKGVRATGTHVSDSTAHISGDAGAPLQVLDLTFDDLRAALRAGYEDFKASRADALFLVLIYPVIGLVLVSMAGSVDRLPLIFPLLAGFALLGPVAALGLYEISRRREKGEDVNWIKAFAVIQSPALGAIVVLALYLCGLFVAWLFVAQLIYAATLGPAPPASLSTFANDVLNTGAGWAMIVVGIGVGFVFALVALCISLVSFPKLIDRNVGVPVAVTTSLRVARRNPKPVLAWGAIVAAALVLGSIPVLIGLVVVLPILGHATWHLYRRAVA